MNKKQVLKIKSMAALFYQAQPKNLPQKSLEQIYNELKIIHKKKNK